MDFFWPFLYRYRVANADFAAQFKGKSGVLVVVNSLKIHPEIARYYEFF